MSPPKSLPPPSEPNPVSDGSVTSPSGAPPSPGLSPYNLSMFAKIPVLLIVSDQV